MILPWETITITKIYIAKVKKMAKSDISSGSQAGKNIGKAPGISGIPLILGMSVLVL